TLVSDGESDNPERPALTVHCPQPADPLYESDVDIVENKIAVLEERADGGDGEQLGLVVSGCFSLHSAEGDAGGDGGHEDDGALEQHPQDGGQEAAKDRCGSGDQKDSDRGKRGLRVQKRRHQSSKKTYECSECGKRYNHKDSFGYHVKTHTGEKPFECDVCNKRFIKKCSFDDHVRAHTGVKPYECNVCKRGFATKTHLDYHVRTHTGEKPYKCDICNMRFILKCNLESHIRTHTGEKPFECDICNKRFTQKSTLDSHVRTHTGEKPFQCNICKHCFSDKSNLRRHKKTHRIAADL
ncbi:zinc finger protein 239-like, partial [Frankliniella occidentalis]|uniref:Zinc finger protein 239-like n=1 Tax=Frankliniella occidentalis TaxID=133901 RepID=A0A9C6UF43_FRAOC